MSYCFPTKHKVLFPKKGVLLSGKGFIHQHHKNYTLSQPQTVPIIPVEAQAKVIKGPQKAYSADLGLAHDLDRMQIGRRTERGLRYTEIRKKPIGKIV